MDQGSDFISDFRARRIRTQISWENLLANSHEVTVTYLKPVPPHARRRPSAAAGSGNEGNKATKNGGMILDSDPGINSPGRLQCITHEASVDHAPGFSGACTRLQRSGWGWCARALGPVRPSRKILGKSWENSGKFSSWPQNPGSHLPEILRILHHQTRVRRDICHVTQPRARINVSCSRASDRGSRGPQKGGCEGWVPDQQRLGSGPGYQNWGGTGRDGEGQHSPEIADEIAPLIHSALIGL